MDRLIPPDYKTIEKIDIAKAQKSRLENQVPVYIINAGEQDVVKIDFIFQAGNWFEPAPLIAYFTNAMLNEGTLHYTSREIAEKFDFLGSFYQYNVDLDFASISIISLNKHLEETLCLVEEVIKHPAFLENELQILLHKRKQQFLIDAAKVQNLAKFKFSQSLFGKSNPYGRYIVPEDFDHVTTGHLAGFHRTFYCAENCKIIASGKADETVFKSLDAHFGSKSWCSNKAIQLPHIKFDGGQPGQYCIEKKDAVQSAIRIGKVLFNRTHPDFIGMQVLNTVIGGYFGSRLMKNIREEKGYTYGISSLLISLKNSGFWVIVSEIGNKYTFPAISEIYKEIEKLQYEKISSEELYLVKNYLLGDILRMFDGPFSNSESFRSILEYGLNPDYYENVIQTVKNISPEQLQQLAVNYLDKDSLVEVVAGKI